MRVVVQRVKKASVEIEGHIKATIEKGMLVLLGIEESDTSEDADWICSKISRLRIFPDEKGIMNLDIKTVSGKIMVVSQFTLHASTKKGNRPSYIRAARPETAIPLYDYFIIQLKKETNLEIETGVFGAMMQIALINDGPVTIIMDSKNKE
ncbi:MAG: D-tyrosyl-tRNA(Tyr) deacylase [Bacteroidetes bacterium HGW-Bacteroidetes-1]|jgi:D-tyrosyl-tRNA(Tyr) deacylase|nr:MAG: D-tyrosyl-tRNA(Tyr) deacylase [Bacteroidetes bacterium HGW-Bacteroidetes-1]